MSSPFNIREVQPSEFANSNATLRVTRDDIPGMEMYFRKSEGERHNRVDDRSFDLVCVRFGSCFFVTAGTCNHIPTIDRMLALDADRILIAEQREKVARLRADLEDAESELRRLAYQAIES